MDFTKEELKNYIKEYQKRSKEAYSRSRAMRVDPKERAKYHREYLDAQAMIRNINYKMTKDGYMENHQLVTLTMLGFSMYYGN